MNKQNKYEQGFGIIEAIIIVAVVSLIGALGWVAYNNFHKTDKTADSNQSSSSTTPTKKDCSDSETTAATSGIFCSSDIGIKFTVPSIFKGKLAKADNYDIFQGAVSQYPGMSAGTSERVFKAMISGTDNFTFSVAQEPLRSGYIGVSHALQNTYFDKESGNLNNADEQGLGNPVPSFTASGVRFYKASDGDAGTMSTTYVAVIKGKIVKIEIKNVGYMGDSANDPTTINASAVFSELDDAIKSLQIL